MIKVKIERVRWAKIMSLVQTDFKGLEKMAGPNTPVYYLEKDSHTTYFLVRGTVVFYSLLKAPSFFERVKR